MTKRVWYASYGSNLSRERFEHYLSGGIPDGTDHHYPGCRDTTAPTEDVPTIIDVELVFGGTSRTWGGGVAFVDLDRTSETRARLYLVTVEQFADIVAQENRLDPGSLDLEVHRELDLGADRAYGLVAEIGRLDGQSISTVTRHRGTVPARPSAPYLRHVAAGLVESHGLEPTDVVSYLADKRGIAGELSADELAALV